VAQHIGIVACSAEGAALCYRTIALEGAEYFGAHGHPEISMHTFPLGAYVDCIDRDFARLALTGTRSLVESDVYPEKLAVLDMTYLRPSDAEVEEIDRIIMEELVRGALVPSSAAYVTGVIAGMNDAGCDAVVLGCTELPLLVDDTNSSLPTLDSTRLLARAALRRSVEG